MAFKRKEKAPKKPAKTVTHIVEEGSRQHVKHWDSQGEHCSEPNCEVDQDKFEVDDEVTISGFGRATVVNPRPGSPLVTVMWPFTNSTSDVKKADCKKG